MATNFPGSQDSFTNPTSSDTLDSPDHAAQHADANDSIEAIQGALLDGAPLHIDDTNERVGIGTTSPNYPLHVSGAVTLSASGSNDSGNSHFPFSDGRFYYTADPETGGTGDHVFRHYSGGSYVEQMRILENGNVGIGTTSPARTPLHVHRADTNAVELHMTNNESGSTSSDGLTIFYDDVSNGAGIWVREASPLRLATSGSERVRIDSSGNVGIGTTSPTYKLDVEDATAAIVSLNDSGGTVGAGTNSRVIFEAGGSTAGEIGFLNTGSGIMSLKNNDGAIYLTTSSADGILFRPNATEAMRITSGGDVGIGDSSPSYKLDVGGTGQFQDRLRVQANGGAILTLRDTGSTDTGGYLEFESSGGTRMGYIGYGDNDDMHIKNENSGGQLFFNTQNVWRAYFNTSGHFLPYTSNTYDLGSSSLRWRNIYTQDLHLSNGIGDYTVVEGEEDLYLTNNLTGKAFKFALIEVDPSEVPDKSLVG